MRILLLPGLAESSLDMLKALSKDLELNQNDITSQEYLFWKTGHEAGFDQELGYLPSITFDLVIAKYIQLVKETRCHLAGCHSLSRRRSRLPHL